jgi:aspartate aminotransferase-like enzyme
MGHMGKPQVLPQTILAVVSGVENSMIELGAEVEAGEGIKKAQQILREHDE